MSDQPARPQEVYCPRCRGGNPPGAQRCMWCDAPFTNPQQVYTPQVAQPEGRRKAPGSRLVLGLVGAAVVLLALGIALFFAVAKPPANNAGIARMNEVVSFGVWKVTVEKSELVPEITSDDSGSKQVADGQYLKVYLTVENIYDIPDKLKSTVSSTNPGTLYSPCNLPACLAYPEREQLVSLDKDIPPHTVRKALAIFDIAKDASGLRLVIQGTMERDRLPIDLGR